MTKTKRKDRGLFEYQERIERLSNIKRPLDKLNLVTDWEIFRPILNEVFEPKEQKAPGGAPHYDYVLMFKILIFQRYYNLSDEETEFRCNDMLSVQRYLGISLSDKVPDCNKIWEFKERLTKAKAIKKLFEQFDKMLENKGIVGKSGVIVDASFVDVPRQRNNRDDNKKIKEGEIPEEWKSQPHKLSHKDTDARWATKNKEKHYGYKNHAKVDVKSKIVRDYEVTSASVHDSQVVEPLLNDKDEGKPFYADSAYVGPTVAGILDKFKVKNRIHEKGYRNKPLTEKQKLKNKRKSRVRVRVEHVFGFVENSMNGSRIRSIGKERAESQIGLMNLVYNLARYAVIKSRIAPYKA